MQELKTNIHIHSVYSDGSKTHQEIIQIAGKSGLDVLIFNDHNILVDGVEGYYEVDGRKLLVITGEEIHDASAYPQKNHLLALGNKKELSHFSDDRQTLIHQIHQQNGAAFLAHPFDPSLPDFNEPDISWDDWKIKDFDGLELWNGFSELKVRSKNKIDAYFFAFFRKNLPLQPPAETLRIWDTLHMSELHVSAIAGSDAHAMMFSAGPFRRILYPYAYHFSTLNNHVLMQDRLNSEFLADKKKVISALAKGNNFIANDLVKPSKGFRFFIESQNGNRFEMGRTVPFETGLQMHLEIPSPAEIRIKKDGKTIHAFNGKGNFSLEVSTIGVYRIECYRKYRLKKRGWIFSNPIYVL